MVDICGGGGSSSSSQWGKEGPQNPAVYYGFYRIGFLFLIEVLWNPLLRFGNNFAKNYTPPLPNYTGNSSYCY